jgi:kynurenine formamidase
LRQAAQAPGVPTLARQVEWRPRSTAWSWDAPFVYTAQKYAESKDAGLIWEGHKAGRDIGYCHLEKLHNLEALPADGFYISCFPHKIRGASAGWTRAVAIFDDALTPAGT